MISDGTPTGSHTAATSTLWGWFMDDKMGSTRDTLTLPHLTIVGSQGDHFEQCLAKALSPTGETFPSFLSDLGQFRSTEDQA
jgi:hypothetical protein